MGTTDVDAVEFRVGQRRDWAKTARGWHIWEEHRVRATAHVSERLVEMAGIEPADRVLDVAAGSGEPSLTAARMVGPEGTVVATDLSPEMLAYGRERAAAAGLDNIEFVEADASSLDFPADSFDAALSRWGIIFEPEPEAAAARIRGFLKPRARMAISSWGLPEQVPMMAIPMRTVIARLNVPPPPPGTPGPLSRPTREAITQLLTGGGFSEVEVEELSVEFEWDSVDDFVRSTQDLAVSINTMLAQHPQPVRDDTWAAIADAVSSHADPDGSLRLTNLALLAVGSA